MKTNQVCGVIPAFMLGLVYFVFSDGKKILRTRGRITGSLNPAVSSCRKEL